MGFPGQTRTKSRSKIQPSQQSAGDRRQTAAAAAAMHVAQISAQHRAASCAWPLATTGQHAPCPRGQRASSRATSALIVGRPSCEVAALRRPSSAQHLVLDKASDRLPCAASAQARGSDQFHEETGTSRDRNKSDHVEDGERRRRLGGPTAACARGGGGRPSFCEWRLGLVVIRIQLAVGPQPLWLRNHNFGLAQRIMVKRLATSPHDPLGITDSACKNHLVVVSVQYGPFNTYIPIRSTTIGKSRVARDPIAMHTSRRSNSDITSVTRVSMTFRVVRTNQYNQDLGLFHSTNGNHLESPNEDSSIDHQVTIHLHAQNITMFPTNETWYITSQMLFSNSGGLILIWTVQSTRNLFRIHSDY
ncbi:hypothetical protein F511_33704 [Dorcoceras hygrometricum]|uniref:Uncharacterized protein n=1 Tax=Dorcoceras hygrometricum TaxID=472368 RepID=A0A2Z7CJ64_9LAMI|nr:hypothetical protein F511_33704 [Dorcoceras hygrometricum]